MAILIFDTETTGLNKQQDQIIELAIQVGIPAAQKRRYRFRPMVPIDPAAQRVHGISAQDLAQEPPFRTHAAELAALYEWAQVLIGYNVTFDLEVLQAEFRRAGITVDLSTKLVIDPLRLWQQKEPRQLQDAHRRFVGGDFEGAHGAVADVEAAERVLTGMLSAFGLTGVSWEALAAICEPERQKWIGPSYHVQRREGDDVAIFAFGKHAGRPLREVAHTDGSYLKWVQQGDFPQHVKELCAKAMRRGVTD